LFSVYFLFVFSFCSNEKINFNSEKENSCQQKKRKVEQIEVEHFEQKQQKTNSKMDSNVQSSRLHSNINSDRRRSKSQVQVQLTNNIERTSSSSSICSESSCSTVDENNFQYQKRKQKKIKSTSEYKQIRKHHWTEDEVIQKQTMNHK
jgi:hypothetical protein